MKGMKVDARVAAAAVALGSIGSGLLGYAIARSRARREYAARLDEAVAEVKAHYSRPIYKKPESPDTNKGVLLVPNHTKWSDVVKDTFEVKSVHNPLEGLDDGSDDEESGDEDLGGGGDGKEPEGADGLQALDSVPKQVGPVGGEPDGPFQITEAAFGELADEGFQTISVTYYAADKTLVDDRDQPIRDIVGTIGTKNPLGLDVLSEEDDPQIRYVRNRRLEVDFEVLLDARSYSGTVLGYGQPNKRREASPKPTAK